MISKLVRANISHRYMERGCNSVVECPLRMRKAPGSNPGSSKLFSFYSPESVALPEVPELDADDAGKCGANKTAMEGSLSKTTWFITTSSTALLYFVILFTCEEVNVVDVVVRPLKALNHWEGDLTTEVREVAGASQIADGPENRD